MELRVLKYFLEVAREENITAAAESLHITQPTLSKQLMDLEDEIGKKLFIRGKRRITLTEDGILLRKRAADIIDLVEKTESELKNTEEVLETNIEKLNIIATYNLIFNAALFVEQGLGSAITLDKLVNVSSNSNLCFKPFIPSLKANLVLVWKKYQVFSKASQKFLDELQNNLK